jgi:hypothetical protein
MNQNNKQQPKQNLFEDGQLAKAIYLRHMSAMKAILNLGEMKFGGRDSSAYKLYKKFVMDEFYVAMTDCFSALEQSGVLQKCPCGTTIRNGYKTCPKCSGSGWCNGETLSEYMIQHGPNGPTDILPL